MECFQTDTFVRFQLLGSATRFSDEIYDIATHTPLFEGLSHPEINAMCSFMNCYAAERGSLLIREGELGGSMLVVLTGSVDVVKCAPDGKSVHIARVGPGQTLGEMSLVDSQPRSASCIADEPVDFALLTREALNEILVSQPRLGNKILLVLLSLLTERLRHAISVRVSQMRTYVV